MTAGSTSPGVNGSDCPAWCGANHSHGKGFHAQCVGELHWDKTDRISVTLTRSANGDGVELGYYAAGHAPAIAFLSLDDVGNLHDYLDVAWEALRPPR